MPNYSREPGVASREQVIGYMGNQVPTENLDLLTYMQIVAETGPTDPVVISGISQLLNNFTYSKAISPAYPKCFLEAAFVANLNCPILVKRVAPQVNDNNRSKVTFTDENDAPVMEIVHNYPNTKDLLRLKLTTTDSAKFKLTIESLILDETNRAASTVLFSETYNLSTDLASTNEVGLSNSADILNDYRSDIQVNILNPGGIITGATSTSGYTVAYEVGVEAPIYFGKSTDESVAKWYDGKLDPETDANEVTKLVAAWNAAITELADWEGEIPAYIMSTTIPVNPTANQKPFENAIQDTAMDINSWPIYNPYVKDYSYENVRGLGAAYGGSTALGKLCLPGFYDTTLLGRKLLLGGGFDYLRTIVSNYYSGKAYAPIMGTDGAGTAACGSNLAVRYTKTQRLALLNSGITPIKWHSRKRISYFVMNNSLNTLDDSISEEQNRRIMNKASHDMDDKLDSIVGKYNLDETRDKVYDLVSDYNRFELKQYAGGAVVELMVKCSEENNTPAIIQASRLEVEIGIRFGRAIRWVNILWKILPVSSE
jgi:hypothetical protein